MNWVSGGEFLIYYGANAVVEKVELAQLIRDAAQNDAAGILFSCRPPLHS